MRLSVQGLHSYYGRAHILDGVSLDAAAGEVVALLGRNGAGKSTTLKSIIGIVRPAEGTVELDGDSIGGEPPHRICRRGLGYVPEERRVFASLTVNGEPRGGAPAPPAPASPHGPPRASSSSFPTSRGWETAPRGR